jgi:hypothetical protein
LNLSRRFNSLGASPLTSPESNILIKGVDLVRSDMTENVEAPLLLLSLLNADDLASEVLGNLLKTA